MRIVFLRQYKGMILFSILFFYLGCGITLNFIRIECAANTGTLSERPINNNFHKIEYAVLILSSPDNVLKRDAIRATWANLINNIFVENGETLYKWNNTYNRQAKKQDIIKIFFAIGTQNIDNVKVTKIYSELSRSNDMLLLTNFEDNYKKLASKLIYSIQWLKNNLKELKYVIKCDDDSFVRADLIITNLDAFAPGMNDPTINTFITQKESLPKYKGLYWGYFDGRAKVFRTGKWQEKEWFLCDTYLPYALGGGYVISRSIVDYVARNSDLLSQYNSEDVSMGVWTSALDGMNRVHDTRFDTEWKSRGCDDNMLVRHKQTTADMFEMYTTLVRTRGTKICKTESIVRKSYKYNWNVLPSSCCRKDRNPDDLK